MVRGIRTAQLKILDLQISKATSCKGTYAALGHIRLDKLTAREIQKFINSLSKECANAKTGKPLAPKTIKHHLSLISDVFTYGVKMGVVSDNPCSKVTIHKGEVKEKQIYSQEEMATLLTKMENEPLNTRISSTLWRTVDLGAGKCSVLSGKTLILRIA